MNAKSLVFIFLCLVSSNLFAQINIVRASNINVNQRFLETQNYSSNSSSGSVDPGTKKYSYSFPGFSGPSITYYLIRKNNFWTIESYFPSPGPITKVLYKQEFASIDSIPGCSTSNPWQIWTGGYGTEYSGPLPMPTFTGNVDNNLKLIGNCYLKNSFSSTIRANVIELPQLTTSDISSIINPQNGSLFYDVTEKSIKVFQNNSWQKFAPANKNSFNPCINSTTIGTTAGGSAGPGINIVNSIYDNSNVFISGRATHSLGGTVNFNNGIGLSLLQYTTNNFIVKFDLTKTAQSILTLGNLNLTGVKQNEDYLYATGYFDTNIVINNQTYSPVGGKDAIILKISKIDNSILWVKTFGNASNEEGLDIVFDSNYIYWLGTYENSSKKNGFLKRLNYNDGIENLNAYINSSSNVYPKSLAYSNYKIFVLGTNESHISVIGPESNIDFNASAGTGVFLINFNSELNPQNQNNLIISNSSNSNQLSISNLEIVNKINNGEYITSFRFGVNALNAESNLLNHTFYSGSLLITTPLQNVNNPSEIVPLNYFKIDNVSKNFALGNILTSSANVEETMFFGNYESQPAVLKFNTMGNFDGAITATQYGGSSGLKFRNFLFINGKIEIPIVISGQISFCGLEQYSGIRHSMRWWTLETCAGD